MAGRADRHGAISDSAKKRAEAAKQYIENMYTDRSKIMNEKKDRCEHTNVAPGVRGMSRAHRNRLPTTLRCSARNPFQHFFNAMRRF